MKEVRLKYLKKGEFFTLRPIEEPKESQVWIRDEYDRSERKYECHNFEDICHFHSWNGDKKVFTDFYF